MLLRPPRPPLLLFLLQFVGRVAGGGDEDCAADLATKYGRSSFVTDGPTDARNLDAFLGAEQRSSLGSLPSAEELAADRAWVDRRYQVPAIRVPDRLSMDNLTGASGTATMHSYIRSGRPFIVTDMIADWPMAGWTCETVSRDFSNEKMAAWNYDPQSSNGLCDPLAVLAAALLVVGRGSAR